MAVAVAVIGLDAGIDAGLDAGIDAGIDRPAPPAATRFWAGAALPVPSPG